MTEASLVFFKKALTNALKSHQLDFIIPINNTSYHVLSILTNDIKDISPPQIGLLNALYYLPDDGARIGLFTSEMEFGRSFIHAAQNIPEIFIKNAFPIMLLVNDARYAREGRLKGLDYLITSESVSPQTSEFIKLGFQKEFHLMGVSSEKFHRGIGIIRNMILPSLRRPFNADATVFRMSIDWESYLPSFIKCLSQMGTLVSIGRGSCEKLSLISPEFCDFKSILLRQQLEIDIKRYFHKLRIYIDQETRSIFVSPMVFANFQLSINSAELLARSSCDPLLGELIRLYLSSIRSDTTTFHRILTLYDIISLFLEIRLVDKFRQRLSQIGIPTHFAIDCESNIHYYGRELARAIENSIQTIKPESSKPKGNRLIVRKRPPIPDRTPDASTIALIKTAAVNHYEKSNDRRIPRTCWVRAGLTFGQLQQMTGLSALTLSMGIDVLSDAGLTESYNMIRELDRGRFDIDRAYNSLSDEFLSVLAMSIGVFSNIRSKASLQTSTSISTMNKVMCFIFYMQGIQNCEVLYNRYGKTIRLVVDKAKGSREHLKQIINQNSQYFAISNQYSQVSLTEDALKRDWLVHLVNKERIYGLVTFIAGSWKALTDDLITRQSKKEIAKKIIPYELFAAFIDCIGESSPEWGIATISHLIELGIGVNNQKNAEAREWYLNDASHKARMLEQFTNVLNCYYREIFARRKFDPLANELLSKFAILRQNSLLLRFMEKLTQESKLDADNQQNCRKARLLEFAELFKPRIQQSWSKRLPQIPPKGFRGYIVYIDLLNMKKLSQLEISWPESIAVQIMTQWASLYNVVSCKTLIDGVIACFHDLYDAIRFCVGAYVQVEEYYSVLSNISGIDTGLIGAISEGEIAQFETMAGTEITGSTIALAATIGKIKGTINFDPKIAEARATDFGSWGIDSGFTIGSGAALLDAHKAFEFLFIKGPI